MKAGLKLSSRMMINVVTAQHPSPAELQREESMHAMMQRVKEKMHAMMLSVKTETKKRAMSMTRVMAKKKERRQRSVAKR